MFVTRILLDAAKEGEGDSPFDVLMSVHGGSNAGDDTFADVGVLREGHDGLDILVCQPLSF